MEGVAGSLQVSQTFRRRSSTDGIRRPAHAPHDGVELLESSINRVVRFLDRSGQLEPCAPGGAQLLPGPTQLVDPPRRHLATTVGVVSQGRLQSRPLLREYTNRVANLGIRSPLAQVTGQGASRFDLHQRGLACHARGARAWVTDPGPARRPFAINHVPGRLVDQQVPGPSEDRLLSPSRWPSIVTGRGSAPGIR